MTTKLCTCLCKAVSFTAELNEDDYSACHCSMCRRWCSGPFLGVGVKITDLKGEANISAYTSSEWAERAFCKNCGTNLYYKVTAKGPHEGMTHISIGLIDDQQNMALTSEIFIDEQPAGYKFAGDLVRKTGAEVFAEVTAGAKE